MLDLIAQNSTLRLVLLASLFALIATGAFMIVLAASARQATRRRLAGDAVPGSGRDTGSAGMLRSDRTEGGWLKLVDAIEKAGLSLVDTNDDSVRQRLVAAGFTAPYAPRVFTLIRLLMVLGLPVITVGLYWMTAATPDTTSLYLTLMFSAALGLYAPHLYLRRRGSRLQREIVNGFPDALDLMLVCVEAGLGLDAAFGRVGMEMTNSHPRLAEQFGSVVLELRAGRSREDALRRMADRAGADEIRAFATLLIQSTKLGSSIAQTLRIYASEMRERRRMRAEEKAHRLPVLLSIPLVACMLPVMIGVLMLPAAIRVIRGVLPHFAGG